MPEITERDSAYTIHVHDYDADPLPTRQPTDEELRAYENAAVYEQQIAAMVREAEPMIDVYSNINEMLLSDAFHSATALEVGREFGRMAQELRNDVRRSIERAAGIEVE